MKLLFEQEGNPNMDKYLLGQIVDQYFEKLENIYEEVKQESGNSEDLMAQIVETMYLDIRSDYMRQ